MVQSAERNEGSQEPKDTRDIQHLIKGKDQAVVIGNIAVVVVLDVYEMHRIKRSKMGIVASTDVEIRRHELEAVSRSNLKRAKEKTRKSSLVIERKMGQGFNIGNSVVVVINDAEACQISLDIETPHGTTITEFNLASQPRA